MEETHVNTDGADPAANAVTLTQLRTGETGRIVAIDGGAHMCQKLDSLGIRVGKEITKISAQWLRGPVLVRQGQTRAALGFGMASRIIVEPVGGRSGE